MVLNKGGYTLRMLSFCLVFTLVACDQLSDLSNKKADVQVTADNAVSDKDDAILQELKQIRGLLEKIEQKDFAAPAKRKRAPTTAQISVKNRPGLGDVNAPVTIVEISDYQCPYCKRFFDTTFPLIKKEYIDTGKLRLVFKDMPLGFHKNARKAAQAAHCAADQGKYWEMHDILFQNAKRLDERNLPEYAKIIKLDKDKFLSCLNSKRHLATIDFDARQASQIGLTGTPSFIIGKTSENIIKGDVVRGAQPFAKIKTVIDKQLKLAGANTGAADK